MSNIYWVTLRDVDAPNDGTHLHFAQVEADDETAAIELALARNRVPAPDDEDQTSTNYTDVVGVVLDGEELALP